MRTQVVFAALAVALTAHAASAAPRPYERTVAPFDSNPNSIVPTPIPKVWIKTVPRPDGSYSETGTGASTRAFYDWVYPWLQPWAATRTGLDREAATFQEFVNDRGATLKKVIAATPGDKLAKFNADMTGQVKTELNAYVNARAKEVTAAKAVEVAMLKSKAALKEVEHVEAMIAAQEDADKKATLAENKAAIQKQIAESKKIGELFSKAVGGAVDLVSIVADPAGSATKVFGMVTGAIINAVIDDHQSELMVLDLQMKALDEAMAKHKNDANAASYDKAKILLQAAGVESIQRMLEEQQIVQVQAQALENLADLEKGAKLKKNDNATDVFYDLRLNHHEFVLAATDLRHRLTRYQLVIDRGPGRHAVRYTPFLSKTIQEVESSMRTPDATWLSTAKASRDYMDRYGTWYTKEHEFVAGQERALNDRVEVLPIDDAVKQLIAKF